MVYAEVRYAPEQHLERRADPRRRSSRRCRTGFAEGEEAARRAARRSSCASCSPRCGTRPAAAEIAELAVAYRDRGVVGFDIAGAEAGYPPTRHLDAFEYLQRENAHFTIHAGEAFGLPSIWQAIQWCGADRLGHGVRIIDDITVGDDGVADAGPAGGVRARQADPARDVPVLQRPDRRGRLDRRAPDRRCSPSCASGSRSTPTTG